MPFRMKIKPIIGSEIVVEDIAFTPAVRQERKSRLHKLFERQFIPKKFTNVDLPLSRHNHGECKPSSISLRMTVQNYIEDPDSEKTQQHCGGFKLYNCFSGSDTDSSDDESSREYVESIHSIVLPGSIHESNLLRNVTALVQITDRCKVKVDDRVKMVVDALVTLGYNAALCESRWEYSESTSCPAGEYKYLDVLIRGERMIIDIDFNSKFKIALPTNTYKSISESLPYIFVGKMDKLLKLVILVSDAARESFKKRKLHVPPWRMAEYVLTKWSSPHVHATRIQGEISGEDVDGEA